MTATKTATKATKTTGKAATPKTPKAEAVTPESLLAAVKAKAEADGITVESIAVEIYEGESKAATSLADVIRRTPILAAQVHGVRGAASKAADAIVKAEGITKTAADQRVTRYVKAGRVLIAHPSLDPVEVYALTNRMTSEQVDAVVTQKDADKALAAGQKAKAANGDKAKAGKADKAATRTTEEQIAAAIKEGKKAIRMVADDRKAGKDMREKATEYRKALAALIAGLDEVMGAK